MIEKCLGDHDRTVLIGNDDIVREDGYAATTDRFAPTDEGQPGNRRRSRKTVAPDRQTGSEHAFEIAHHAVGHQRRHAALDHACAQNIPKNAGVSDAHGIDHGDTALRHGFDRGAGRNRRGPGFRRRQIFPSRHKTQREGRPDQPRLSRPQRTRAPHPDVSQALLEQNRGDGGGRYAGKGFDCFGGQGHRNSSSGYGWIGRAHLAGRGHRVKCHCRGDCMAIAQSQRLITAMRINLLDLRAHLREANSASPENTLELDIR